MEMGIEELRRGLEMAQLDDNADFGTPASPELISSAEEYLGVTFPPTYREFVASVGWGSFAGREFYGITPSGVIAKAIPSVIFATKDERQHGLPSRFLLIEDPGGEEEYVIDTQDLGRNGDAPVKVWTPASDPANLEVVADDFGSYLLRAAEAASA
jgi:cell wall assembly regulator SMI1